MALVVKGRTFDPASGQWRSLGGICVASPDVIPDTPPYTHEYDLTDADFDVVMTGSVGGILRTTP